MYTLRSRLCTDAAASGRRVPQRVAGAPGTPTVHKAAQSVQRVKTSVEMLRAPTLMVAWPPFTLVGWLAALAFCEVR
ncbi:hypothetical protein MED15_00643 [Micromonospora noduli]|uniref:Uncharacterized protein n=1 Tax=Micromonospora noduli TaxID=709876 RepID=A0ABX9DAD6_9ACTN|nr:hypothetical protein MED15_00643 [Micromonospora noduli]